MADGRAARATLEKKTLTRLAALATLSRSAGEGLSFTTAQSPSPAPWERGDQARQRLVGEGGAATSASRSTVSPITHLGKSGRRIGAYIKIALGVRDANALLLEQSPDLVKDLALDVMDAILRVLDPEPQLESTRSG